MPLTRQTILTVLSIGLAIGLVSRPGTAAEKVSLAPPVHLPDGAEFLTWETSPLITKTYYVDQANPKASDDNPGSQTLPFKTINRAAVVLQPGERVLVAAGVYRERVRPARGGTDPARMIHYEAAAGAKVIVSGSQVLKTSWNRSDRNGDGRDLEHLDHETARRAFRRRKPVSRSQS